MGDRALWIGNDTATFIEYCVEEVRLGMRTSGCLKPCTFAHIGSKLEQTIGRSYTPKQLRTKWDTLRKSWVKWNWLKRYAASGIGWNERRQTFDAPDEWWQTAEEEYKKKKPNDSILQFRTEGLKHKDGLEEMFKGTKGTNRRAWAPSSSIPPPEDSPEGSGDSDGDPRFVDPNDNYTPLHEDEVQQSLQEGEGSGKRKHSATVGKNRLRNDGIREKISRMI